MSLITCENQKSENWKQFKMIKPKQDEYIMKH